MPVLFERRSICRLWWERCLLARELKTLLCVVGIVCILGSRCQVGKAKHFRRTHSHVMDCTQVARKNSLDALQLKAFDDSDIRKENPYQVA